MATHDPTRVPRQFHIGFAALSDICADLVYRGIALCALFAFLSSGWQITALIGENGILPAGELLSAANQEMDLRGYWYIPTLFWIHLSDTSLLA
ncbi:MAG: hypothetical protein O7E57_13725, partial [Gammaproteobacteria bacterium]|nr:hypothetical protein [Gammaproteobacteria bacterium]